MVQSTLSEVHFGSIVQQRISVICEFVYCTESSEIHNMVYNTEPTLYNTEISPLYRLIPSAMQTKKSTESSEIRKMVYNTKPTLCNTEISPLYRLILLRCKKCTESSEIHNMFYSTEPTLCNMDLSTV